MAMVFTAMVFIAMVRRRTFVALPAWYAQSRQPPYNCRQHVSAAFADLQIDGALLRKAPGWTQRPI
jgi:hypothetical protein